MPQPNTNKDFSEFTKGGTSVATLFEDVSAGVAKTFSTDGSNDGPPPRSIYSNGAGTVSVTGWNDEVGTFTVVEGVVLPIMPKTISASTDVAITLLW